MNNVARILVAASLVLLGGCRNKLDGGESSPTPAAADQKTAIAKPAPTASAHAAEEKPTIPAPQDVAAPPANAQRSESGLAWVVLKPGTGTDKPNPDDKVTVHYTGWSADGTMFDSSEVRGRPTTFSLSRVIAGWTEGVGMMTKASDAVSGSQASWPTATSPHVQAHRPVSSPSTSSSSTSPSRRSHPKTSPHRPLAPRKRLRASPTWSCHPASRTARSHPPSPRSPSTIRAGRKTERCSTARSRAAARRRSA